MVANCALYRPRNTVTPRPILAGKFYYNPNIIYIFIVHSQTMPKNQHSNSQINASLHKTKPPRYRGERRKVLKKLLPKATV
jgi:hypothetical protein